MEGYKRSIALEQRLTLPEQPPRDEAPVEVKPKKKKLTKAEKRELKRQREIEFKKLELRTEFRREIELSRQTAKKLKYDWEETIQEMKLIELRRELMAWEQKIMYRFNEKQEKIESMLTLINDFEETNQLFSARIKGFFDYVLDVYKSLLISSKTLYEQVATNSLLDFYEALQTKTAHDETRQLHCENIMHTTNIIFEKELLNDYTIFVECRNENVNVEIEKRYRIRDNIVNKMKSVKNQLAAFVQQLTATNLDPHKYERIRQLMGRQRAFYIESTRLNELETKQNRLYSDMKRELAQSEQRFQKQATELRLEQSYFIEIRRRIEENIETDRVVTYDKLKVLSSESYVVLKHFEKLRDEGELLLSVASNVRKLQTEAEKVLVWGNFLPSEDKTEIEELRKFVLTVINATTHVDRDNEQFYNEMNLMRVFWQRMAIVETQNAMLRKEKLELLAENKKYTDFIRTMRQATEPEKLLDTLSVIAVQTSMSHCPEWDC